MNTLSARSISPAGMDEDAWDDLLNFMEDKRVIPIIGPELLHVSTDSGPRLLYDWLAEKLAVKFNIDTSLLPADYNLNDVVCWFLGARGRREEAYTRLRSVLREATFVPPPALHKLAQITDFTLFVSTTFDSLLEQAINLERFGGDAGTEALAYAPNRVVDLPTEFEDLKRPTVYHLLGKLSSAPNYVISDEDTLEFICALQSEHLMPEKLFHALEHSHLLFIGSNFSNWLARIFLRMAKRQRLSDPRDVGEILADGHSGHNERLMGFLQQVSVRTRVYDGAEKFVDELHARWSARQSPAKVIAMPVQARRLAPPAREMPEHAVFISYAREDLEAVQTLRAGLEAVGVPVWFDLDQLDGGDDFDRKIRANIARCSYFIPIISANTQRRLEGYFRREWNDAIDRTRNMADGSIFILPVMIDDTDTGTALVPEKFKALHITRLAGGDVTPEFAQRLRDFLSR